VFDVSELAAIVAAHSEKSALLSKTQQRCESLDCDVMNLRSSVARRNTQISMIEADLQARQQREASLSARLAEALASTDPHVPRLRDELIARDEEILQLRADLELASAHAAEKDQDLQVAEESIRNLEIDVRDKTGKLEEANVTVEEWRAVIAESQRSILKRDGRIQQLESDWKGASLPFPIRRRKPARRSRSKVPHVCSSALMAIQSSSTCSAAARASDVALTTNWCSTPSTSAAITRCCWQARCIPRSKT
jgi:DNA repair exonuclease SbcCD ATPase subunit